MAAPKRINEQQSVGDRGKYDVGIAEVPQVKARVEIRGGEALRLRVTERRGQEYLLEHLPYEEERVSRPESVLADNPAADMQGDEDFHPRRFHVSGLEPQVDGGNTVTLRVSIENGQPERFSPRPQWVWGEITPLRRAGDQVAPIDAHDGFLVADVDFEPGLPVPVLRLQAGPWPERVDRDSLAELKLWFSTRSVNPSGRQPLGDLESGDERRARKIPKDRDVTYRMEFSRESGALQVTVFERHPGPFHGSSYDARRVELSVPADEVRREYYPNVGRVNHVFRYADATEEQLRGALLEVYRVEDLKKAEHGTVECPEPLLIPLGRRR